MAEMAYASGTGNCAKCGEQLLQLEGNEDTPGGRQCIKCQSKRMISSGPINDTPDIGEDALNSILSAAGVRSPGVVTKPLPSSQPATKSVAPMTQPAPVVVNVVPGQSFEELVGEALKIMKSLPMPKGIKEFKSINKIIGAMEALVQEK